MLASCVSDSLPHVSFIQILVFEARPFQKKLIPPPILTHQRTDLAMKLKRTARLVASMVNMLVVSLANIDLLFSLSIKNLNFDFIRRTRITF